MLRPLSFAALAAFLFSFAPAEAAGSVAYVTNGHDSGPGSFRAAIERANGDPRIGRIVFHHGVAAVTLSSTVTYSGRQDIRVDGRHATIRGGGGAFDLFTTTSGADLTLQSVDFEESGARGVVVVVPPGAKGTVHVVLTDVSISDNASFGLHVDDSGGSPASIALYLFDAVVEGNGLSGGLDDVDGVRVDERGEGSIQAAVVGSFIAGNAFDGIELDEGDGGHITALITAAYFVDNGFGHATAEEPDDGIDLDEAGDGSLFLSAQFSAFEGNADQGIDIDEAGDGDAEASLIACSIRGSGEEGMKSSEADAGSSATYLLASQLEGNGGDGIQIEETEAGDLSAHFTSTRSSENGSDGVQLEEGDEGDLAAVLSRSRITLNDKDGFKAEQVAPGEGTLHIDRHTSLEDNGDDPLDLDGVLEL